MGEFRCNDVMLDRRTPCVGPEDDGDTCAGSLHQPLIPIRVGHRLLSFFDFPLRNPEAARDVGLALLYEGREGRDHWDLILQE